MNRFPIIIKRSTIQLFEYLEKVTVNQEFDNWETLKADIKFLKENKKQIVVKTYKSLPDEIIWDLAFSAFNVVQIIIDLEKSIQPWFVPLLHKSKTCGIDCIIYFPVFTPLKQIFLKVFQVLDYVNGYTQLKLIFDIKNKQDDNFLEYFKKSVDSFISPLKYTVTYKECQVHDNK